MKQRESIRRGLAIILAMVLMISLFPLNGKASSGMANSRKSAINLLTEEATEIPLLLPYYMSERDTLPMTIGDSTIQWTSDNSAIDATTGKVSAPERDRVEVNLEATITMEDNSIKKKKFIVNVLPSDSGYILSYTREEDDTIKGRSGQEEHGMYQSAVTDSMHLGYSADGKTFEALNYNTGVLFAKNKGEKTKVLKQPYIFRMKDGSFGVLAVRTNEVTETDEEETENEDKGKLLLFTSKDLLSYEEVKLLTVSDTDSIQNPSCVYDKVSDKYYISWTSEETSEGYINQTTDFTTIEEKTPCELTKAESIESGIKYAIESNVIAITPEEGKKILNKLKPIYNTAVEDAEVETECGKPLDLTKVKVKANYSDGSKADKSVTWSQEEMAKVDFDKIGTYKVTGTVRTLADKISKADNYPFIAGNADPNVVKFNGKYYFIATNESGNLNFYIREADTVTGLKTAKKHLIYNEAKGKEGNIVSKSNHWAPELHVINNELYMFFATNVGTGWDVQCAIMKLKTGGNPTEYADWEAPKRYLDSSGKNLNRSYGGITLDMTHFSYNNRHYVIWSQRNFSKNGGTADLWIGETTAENPGQLISKAVKIVSCEYGWERNHEFVTEGPNVILTADKLYLTYSGGATDETYCVGMTQVDLSSDVDFLNANSWKKSNYPLLTGLTSRGDKKYHGPGHNSYVTDEDGNLINVFHARPGDGSSFQRDAFLRVVHFGADGSPILDMEEEVEVLPENRKVSMTITVTERKPEELKPTPTLAPSGTDNQKAAVNNNNSFQGSQTDGNSQMSKSKQVKVGTVFAVKGMQYKITGKKTAEFVKASKKNRTRITIPNTVKYGNQTWKVTSIAAKACMNNKKLKQVFIGKNITKIGAKAFCNCKKLKTIKLKSTKIKKLGVGTFKNINKKAVLTVPPKRLKAYRTLLKGNGLPSGASIKK